MEVELRSLDEALLLLDEWASAYEELRKDHSRLLHRYMLSQKALRFARYAIECDLWLEEQRTAPVKSDCPF